MSVIREEQETTINIARTESKAHIYTSDTTMMNKLHKLSEKSPENWHLVGQDTCNGEVTGEIWECPKKCISLRTGASRKLTPEQRQAAADRLRRARESHA